MLRGFFGAELVIFELSALWLTGPCPTSLAEQLETLAAEGFETFVTGREGLVPVSGPWWHTALQHLQHLEHCWLDLVAVRGAVRHLLWHHVPVGWLEKALESCRRWH